MMMFCYLSAAFAKHISFWMWPWAKERWLNDEAQNSWIVVMKESGLDVFSFLFTRTGIETATLER